MISIGDKTIKLQIWDTVHHPLFRLDNNLSNQSPEGIIDRLQEPSSSMISPTVNHLITCQGGCRKLRLTATLRCASWWWGTSAIWNQSK